MNHCSKNVNPIRRFRELLYFGSIKAPSVSIKFWAPVQSKVQMFSRSSFWNTNHIFWSLCDWFPKGTSQLQVIFLWNRWILFEFTKKDKAKQKANLQIYRNQSCRRSQHFIKFFHFFILIVLKMVIFHIRLRPVFSVQSNHSDSRWKCRHLKNETEKPEKFQKFVPVSSTVKRLPERGRASPPDTTPQR